MTKSQTPRRERTFLEAGFFGFAVIFAILGGVGILITLLLLAFGADPLPMLGASAFVLAASAALWFYSRLARE